MTYTYTPKGVCSRKMTVELDEGGVIKAVRVDGGCSAIERMRGIRCGMKPTSCPDQLSYALEKALKAE